MWPFIPEAASAAARRWRKAATERAATAPFCRNERRGMGVFMAERIRAEWGGVISRMSDINPCPPLRPPRELVRLDHLRGFSELFSEWTKIGGIAICGAWT